MIHVMKGIRILVIFGGVLALGGCKNLEQKDPSTLDHMQDTLYQGAKAADEITKAEKLDVSDEVASALMRGSRFGQSRTPQEPRFDISVKDVPASTFFSSLVEGTPYNMVVHPNVSGNVTLNLADVTVRDALEVVRDVYGYEYSETRVGFEIQPIGLQTRIYPLDYLHMQRIGSSGLEVTAGGLTDGEATSSSKVFTSSEQDVWTSMQQILESIIGAGDGRSVATSPQSGVIIVRAFPEELRKVEEFLMRTQKSLNRQVILDAKVLEVTLDDGYQHGINWGAIVGRYGFNQVGGGSTLGGSGTNSTTQVSGIAGNGGNIDPSLASQVADGAIQAFGGMFAMSFQTGGFSYFVELLNQQGNVQVLSSPRVATLNNQKAIIKIGTDEYYVTDVGSNTSTSSGSTTTSADVSLDPFFSGIALDVTPFIDENNNVTLHVHPTITTVSESTKTVVLDGKNQTYPLAKSILRESDSVVRAKSGQIIIIGGLMKHETVEVNTSVPWLGDIPFFGSVFRQTKQVKSKKELVILLRPSVVDTEDWAGHLRNESDRFADVDRGFHFGGRSEMFGYEAEYKRTP